LKVGKSRGAISANIKELTHSTTKAGKARNARPNAHAVNVAIAMRQADKANTPPPMRKKGARR
jgi:hypothetical protein